MVHSERANLHFIGCWSLMIPPPGGPIMAIFTFVARRHCVIKIGRWLRQREFCASPATSSPPPLHLTLQLWVLQECEAGEEPLAPPVEES